jgi:F0F1-type ATP synthase assembly protein I
VSTSSNFDDGPDLRTEPKRPEQSLGELLGEVTRELGELFRSEVQLAKVEARDEVRTTAKGAAAVGAGAVGAVMALLFVSLALAWLLDQAMNTALAFLIVAVLWGIAAAVLITVGRKRFQQLRPLPQTTATLKEDVQWAKTLKS